MNLEFEDVVTIGWLRPVGAKPPALLVLYCGSDFDAARDVANDALERHTVDFVRVVRGGFPSGSSQLLYRSSVNHPPQKPTAVMPPTGKR